MNYVLFSMDCRESSFRDRTEVVVAMLATLVLSTLLMLAGSSNDMS